MASFIIEGGHQLHGEITPQGAKNEALQVICATLLTDEEVIIHNVPNILDVNNLIILLEQMGVVVKKIKKGSYSFCANNIDYEYTKSSDFIRRCGELRGSIMLVGPLLTRFGKAIVPTPGGDKIGRRRLDTHLNGIIKLGGKLVFDEEKQLFLLSVKNLKGNYLLLDEASVTGTANLLMTAVFAEGKTTIFSRYVDEKGRHIRYIRNEDKAKLSADNRTLYVPFAPNWIVKGNIIRDNGVIKFDFLNLITKNGYNTINNTDYE